MYTIEHERRQHAAAIEHLLDLSFGPDRTAKTVYKLREGVPPVAELCFVAFEAGVLKGSLRFWPVLIGGHTPALLLGPLAVDPAERGKGIGIGLMEHALAEATRLGHRIVILVGDAPYYARVGFAREGAKNLQLPGWVDENRFLARALVPGALDGLSGMVERAEPDEPRRVAAR
jgi:predicted N-acetyltransferase YhbS